eukprot:CFRG3194T1
MFSLGLSWRVLNTAAFAVNTLATYAVGAANNESGRVIFGLHLQSNKTISEKYPTLVTPSGYAFAIWAPIFTLQAVITVVDAVTGVEPFSLSSILGDESIWWCGACLAQAAWALVFGSDCVVAAAGFLSSIALCLRHVYTATATYEKGVDSSPMLVLIQLVFAMHSAWVNCAALLNVNIALVALEFTPVAQLYFAWVTLALALSIGLYTSTVNNDPVPSLVTAWALLAIGNNANSQKIATYTLLADSAILKQLHPAFKSSSFLCAAYGHGNNISCSKSITSSRRETSSICVRALDIPVCFALETRFTLNRYFLI